MMHEFMNLTGKAGGAGLLLATGLLLAAPVHAGGVTVTEGETARFQITATPKWSRGNYDGPPAHIRLWYDTHGGTAIEGEDYETAHSWAHSVQGFIGQPLTVSVETFGDDAVEGDETFRIRIRKMEARYLGRFGQIWWRTTPVSRWNFTGAKTATIEDATPSPQQQHASYEDEKYGAGYTGTVWGE